MSVSLPSLVVVHPLVLLSVVDHFTRVIRPTSLSVGASNTDASFSPPIKKRVVGALLGNVLQGNVVNITNSFALPFEEDDKDPNIWYLDHNYHEAMNDLFRKVSAKEKFVGWYHTGPTLHPSDIQINNLFKKYTLNPVLVIIDVEPKQGIPTESFVAVEEIHDDGSVSSWTFDHVLSRIDAEEAEEIGVEHLLRDIRDDIAFAALSQSNATQIGGEASKTFSSRDIIPLSMQINASLSSLWTFSENLNHIQSYLNDVVNGVIPTNQPIMYLLQDIFNDMPAMNARWKEAMQIQSNDRYSMIYVASLARSIMAVHSLIDNKIANREEEKKTDQSISPANDVSNKPILKT